jgi:hypothetical protein
MTGDSGGRTGNGAAQGTNPRLSVVVPVYNEAAHLQRLCALLAPVLDGTDGDGFVAVVGRALDVAPWPVLTLHAEAEGECFLGVAKRLLARLVAEGVRCRPLSEVVASIRAASGDPIPVAEIVQRPIRGRAGRVAMPAGLEPSR